MNLKNRKVGIMDTTLRDGHQSLLATRMRTEDMLPIAEKVDKMGFYSLEVWGGATFDTCMRFLNENPWERLRLLRKAFKNTKLQMLLRGQNLVGYKHYADDVVEAFIEEAAKNGIDIFRVFDALNDVRNMRKSIEEVKKQGKHAQGTISYTTGSAYTLKYYTDIAQELKEMGADSICIKDMAGILTPYFAYDLVSALKNKVDLPVQMHTHYTSGMGAMMYLKAVEAGADVIDCANSAFAMGTSQPATETMVAVLNDAGADTGIDLNEITQLSEYFKDLRTKYKKYDVYSAGVDVNVLRYQIPGGMLSNFINQLKEQDAADKLPQVLEEVPRVRDDLGQPPLVTPSSQIVGTQAVLNVLAGERYKMVTNEVKAYLKGQYGKPAGKIDEQFRKSIIGDEEVIEGRPADYIKPEMEASKKEIGDLAKNREQLLMYIMFPQVAKDFLEGKIKAEDLTVPEEKKEILPASKEQEIGNAEPGEGVVLGTPGNKIVINFNANVANLNLSVLDGNNLDLTFSDREKRFTPIGSPRPIPVQKRIFPTVSSGTETAAAGDGAIISPLPGKVTKIFRKPGNIIKKGEVILIVESMKMENEITAKIDGKIAKVNVAEGDSVKSGDLLAVIE